MKLEDLDLTLYGREMQQAPSVIRCFEGLFSRFRPKCILEIGAAAGGLSLYLSFWAYLLGGSFVTIDRESIQGLHNLFRQLQKILPVRFILGDWEDKLEFCEHYMHSSSPSLTLCDASDKVSELRSFAPLLRSMDVIMIHDYRIELPEDVVKKTRKEYNLVELFQEDLWDANDTNWVCLRKL